MKNLFVNFTKTKAFAAWQTNLSAGEPVAAIVTPGDEKNLGIICFIASWEHLSSFIHKYLVLSHYFVFWVWNFEMGKKLFQNQTY